VLWSITSDNSRLLIATKDFTNLWMHQDGEWQDGMVRQECWQQKQKFLTMVLRDSFTMFLGSWHLDASRRFTPTSVNNPSLRELRS
jgi:hypothetical protein